jgi:hypothetical protein
VVNKRVGDIVQGDKTTNPYLMVKEYIKDKYNKPRSFFRVVRWTALQLE